MSTIRTADERVTLTSGATVAPSIAASLVDIGSLQSRTRWGRIEIERDAGTVSLTGVKVYAEDEDGKVFLLGPGQLNEGNAIAPDANAGYSEPIQFAAAYKKIGVVPTGVSGTYSVYYRQIEEDED